MIKGKKTLLITVTPLIIMIILSGLAVYRMFVKSNNQIPKTFATPITNEAAKTQHIEISTSTENNRTDIIFYPQENNIVISAFSLKAQLASKNNKLSVSETKIEINKELTNWSFPINRVYQNPDDSITIELSALYLKPEGFPLIDILTVGSINTQNSDIIIKELSEKETEFIDNEGVSSYNYRVK